MEQVLEGLNMDICAVYLDDVIVYAPSKEDLYARLSEVFSRFRAAGLRLKPSKCKFFQTSVEFLGFVVSEEGTSCSTKHLEAVVDWPVPNNVKQLQTFLGFTNFYRKFIPGYASIAEPLYGLLRGQVNVGRGKKVSKSSKRRGLRSPPMDWKWEFAQQTAFEKLKSMLVSPPILAYPDFDKPFVVHVDASRIGLGAVLYQKTRENKLEVLAYASKSLSPAEKNYSAHKLEFLGLKWAITVKFHHYLYGKPFTIFTDHNPLAYVTTTAKLDAVGHRWLAELSDYVFEIFYKPGRLNNDADGLSRRPHPEVEQGGCTQRIGPEIFKEVCSVVTSDEGFSGVAEYLAVPSLALSNAITVQPIETLDWAAEQHADTDIDRVMD